MSDHAAILLVIGAGALFAFQAPINSGLGRTVGGLPASMVSFATATGILLALVLASGQITGLGEVAHVPAYELTGGLLGAAFVLAATLSVGAIGAGAVAAGVVTGQLIGGIALDEVGFLGLDRSPMTVSKGIAAVLLLAGTLLVVRRRGGGESRGSDLVGPRLGIVLMVCGGVVMAVQAPINAALAHSTGDLPASLVSFAVGTLVLLSAVAAAGQAAALRRLGEVRWYYLLGGAVGVVVVTASLLTVEIIGAKALTAAVVTGQMAASLVLDRIGFLGLARVGITPRRLAGVALLAAGTALVV